MKYFAAAAVLAAAVSAVDTSNHWAVIMAGSNTYSNYRHQADTHHAVEIMIKNGIPLNQIIHLAYDDIANNSSNPFPGQLFNHPATGAGVNVYNKSHIDYRGAAVNKENFFKVLLGDKTAPGPVLGSNSTSKVFVNFVDHGGAGLICTPQGSADWIYADELNDTLQKMKNTGMFGELVFYLETCESGSMFPNITSTEGIYAMTASNATLSSWAAYCGSDAMVNGKNIGSCLGDLFSVNWMEDTEAANISSETLEQQYETVLAKTTASPVQKFGDFSFMSEPIGDFEGNVGNSLSLFENVKRQSIAFLNDNLFGKQMNESQKVDSRDHELHFLMQQAVLNPSDENIAAVHKELKHREFIDSVFSENFEVMANAPEIPQNFDCLRFMVGQVEELCGPWSAYSLKYVRKLANVCDTKTEEEIADLIAKVYNHCQ